MLLNLICISAFENACLLPHVMHGSGLVHCPAKGLQISICLHVTGESQYGEALDYLGMLQDGHVPY